MELSIGAEALRECVRKEEAKLKSLCELLKDTEITTSGKNPDNDVLRNKHAMLAAESEELEEREVEGIPLNWDLQVALLKEHMEQQVKGLQDFSEYLQSAKTELLSKVEKLSKYLEMEKEVVSISGDDSELNQSNQLTPGNHVDEKIKELKKKNNKMKVLINLRTTQMRVLLGRMYPTPDEGTVAESSRKDPFNFGEDGKKKSLLEIIELLMNASLVKSDPWVTIDSTMWAPYIELLLNTRLVLVHPRNNNMIRLEKFHE